MSTEEYFAIINPTDKDFRAWTKSFFARADKAIECAENIFRKSQKRININIV